MVFECSKYMLRPGDDLGRDEDARQLVRMAGGLPIAIELWGGMPLTSMRSLIHELNTAKKGMEILKVDESGVYDYGTFFLGLEAQLRKLEQSSKAEEQELARCYLMLAVFREDEQVPLDVFRRLWSPVHGDPMSETRATQIARALAGQQLVKIGKGLRLSLLDLHRQYIVHRSRSALPGWHAQLLRRCGQVEIGHSLQEGYWEGQDSVKRFMHHLLAADFGIVGGADKGMGKLDNLKVS